MKSQNKIYTAVSIFIFSFIGCYEQEQTEVKERQESVLLQTGSDSVRSVSPSVKPSQLIRKAQENLNPKSHEDDKYIQIGEPKDASDIKATAVSDPEKPALVIGEPLDANDISDRQIEQFDKDEIIIGVPIDASNLEPVSIADQNTDVVIIGDPLDASNINADQLNVTNAHEIIGETLDANIPYNKQK